MTTAELLRAIQHRTARVAIGSSSMRGAGNTGVVTAARTHLGRLDLRPFGTRHDDRFRAELNSATTRLRAVLPEDARHWGLARKGLNIFLRNCLYTVYLRERYRLDRVFRMIKRRVTAVGLGEANCHTFRATGITAYLLNGGTLERAQRIAAHESPRTTKLYDRTADEVTVEDIEKIGI